MPQRGKAGDYQCGRGGECGATFRAVAYGQTVFAAFLRELETMKDHKTLQLGTMAIYFLSFVVSLWFVRISWRAVFFGVRLTIARRRAVSGADSMTRWFGRASIAYCANIIAFKNSGALKRGSFLAKRVMGAARAACKAENKAGGESHLSGMAADRWIDEIRREAMPHVQSSDNSQRREHDNSRRGTNGRSGDGRTARRHPQRNQARPAASAFTGVNAEPQRASNAQDPPKIRVVIPTEPPDIPDFHIAEPPDGFEDFDPEEAISMAGEDLDRSATTRLAV